MLQVIDAVQRRASNTGVIMVTGQKIALGRIHAGRTVTVHVAEHTLTIELDDEIRTIRRTNNRPVRRIKGERPLQRAPRAEQTELSASVDQAES